MKATSTEFVNLILSPHLDDAAFSLGGLIQKETANTKVLTIFAGTPNTPISTHWDRVCGFANSTDALETRKNEDRAALLYLGLAENSIVYFPYLDKQYRTNKKDSSDKLQSSIASDISEVMKEHAGKTIRLFIPMMGLHEDHKIVRDAVLFLYKKELWDTATVQLYLYQDMPYTFLSYLVKRILHPFSSTAKIVSLLQPKNIPCVPEGIELTDSQSRTKILAAKKYASQFRQTFSAITLIKKAHGYLSKTQARAYTPNSLYCEVIYHVK